MKPMLAKALVITAAIAGGLGLLSTPAIAGSYIISACSPSRSSGPWAQTNTFPANFATGNQCGGPANGPTDGSNTGALYAEDILNSPGNIPDGARAGWTMTAPTGAVITAISYYRTLHSYGNPNVIAGLFAADGAPLEQCKIPWPFVPGSSNFCDKVNNQTPATFAGLSTNSLFLGVMCRIVDGALCLAGGAPFQAARADLYSARVTLSESVAPAISSVGGALWGGGIVSGVVPVTFAASDASGIQEQLVRSDTGQTLISLPQACDFGATPPCPQQPAGSLSVDTARVADGPRTFTLSVSDPAANSQIATSPTVVVDNNGPPAPTLTAHASSSNAIALSWRNAPNPPAPITGAMVQLCQTTCPAATRISASGAAQLTAPAAGTYSVRLWLLDSQGRGGPHNAALATVTVPKGVDTTPGSTKHTKITAQLKGRRLRVSGTVARSGRVRVSWRSKIGVHTVASGSRLVAVRSHHIAVTFTPPPRARARRATTRVAVRAGRQIVAQARARRS